MYIIIIIVQLPAFQYEGGVRLVNGPYSSEGILEVFLLDTWYTVCTESFSSSAASAVCTQLGYTTPTGISTRYSHGYNS